MAVAHGFIAMSFSTAIPPRKGLARRRGEAAPRGAVWRREEEKKGDGYPPIHPNRHDSRRVAASSACASSLSGPRGKPRDEPMIAITSRMLPV
ncbi:hypothetical protein BCO71171_03855 [Burkholderia contaminans]|uniref:Uncharacterized protein n=1 Tax=Burkholderia contaminans TaxID=488447 RepID=A0A6P2Z611_9BURK|nr:hypothetical protein BCO71171_03855 [Burkholderia contaminans]